MSAFDDLDAMVLDTAGVLFGDTVTIIPMAAAGSVNDKKGPDGTREPMTGIVAIRSKWSERMQIGGQGMPTPSGNFKLAAAGARVIASIALAGLAWVPKQDDEVIFDDKPGERFRIAEPMPDGLSGLHLGLTRIGG